MPKLYSSKHIESVLEKHEFRFIAQKGSHKKFRKKHLTVIVPANKKEIPMGTFHSILRQSELKVGDF